jgi:type IV pilus biogenesis protein CpaD/CtpE
MEIRIMNKVVTLLLALSLPLNSYSSECQVPVKTLEEGAPAPCKGYLFSPEAELQLRILKKDHELLQAETDTLNTMLDKYKKKDEEYVKVMDLQVEKTELWKTKAEDITLKYVQVEENRTKRDFGFILLGIGLTVLGAWAAGQVAPGR